jgi:WD40 repeat protein
VWSISQDCLLNRLELHNSVISLAFQPQGPYLAVATGPELYLWDWAAKASPAIEPRSGNLIRSGDPSFRRKERVAGHGAGVATSKSGMRKDGSSSNSREETHFTDVACMKIVAHTRNMRAVVFHPFGDVLFVAAPDSPVTLSNGDSNVVVGCR